MDAKPLDIIPFWRRIPQLLGYPADITALIFISILSLLTLTIKLSLVGGSFLYLTAFVFFFKYAYSILEWTAKGHLTLPTISVDTIAPTNLVVFKQLFVLITLISVVAYVAQVSRMGAGVLGIFFLFALPASIMTLAYQDSIVDAINPLTLLTFISSIGVPYLLFYGFIVLLYGSLGVVSWGISHYTDSLFIQSFVFMYFMLISFHLMGYIMYQYHEELGISVVQQPAYHNPAAQQKAVLDSEVTALVSAGDLNQAIAVMQDQLKSPGAGSDLYDRYHQLLMLANHARLATKNGRQYISILLYHDKNTRRAVEIFKDCYQLDPEFALADSDQIYELANTARQMREFATAIAIIGRFQENDPNHRDIPKTYLMAAKMLCEEMNDDAKARKILEFLAKKFTHHPLTPEIQEYLALVKKLGAIQ